MSTTLRTLIDAGSNPVGGSIFIQELVQINTNICMKGYKMKILTSNVQLTFTCENDKCTYVTVPVQSDPVEMTNSGVPICPECGDDMVINPECFIKN